MPDAWDFAPSSPSPSAGTRAQGPLSILVSLFLLLLVFFVLLVSVSRVEAAKLAAVATSLDRALANLPSRLGLTAHLGLPVVSETQDADRTAPESVTHDIGALITGFTNRSDGPAGTAEAAPHAPLADFAAPVAVWFDGSADTPSRSGHALAVQLAVLLQRRPDPTHFYHLRMTYAVPDGDAPSSADARHQAINRISSLAAALFGAGCPPETISVAVAPIASPAARLLFRLTLDGADSQTADGETRGG